MKLRAIAEEKARLKAEAEMLAALSEEEKYLARRLEDEMRFRKKEEETSQVKEDKKEHYRQWMEREKKRNMEREAGHPQEMMLLHEGIAIEDDEDFFSIGGGGGGADARFEHTSTKDSLMDPAAFYSQSAAPSVSLATIENLKSLVQQQGQMLTRGHDDLLLQPKPQPQQELSAEEKKQEWEWEQMLTKALILQDDEVDEEMLNLEDEVTLEENNAKGTEKNDGNAAGALPEAATQQQMEKIENTQQTGVMTLRGAQVGESQEELMGEEEEVVMNQMIEVNTEREVKIDDDMNAEITPTSARANSVEELPQSVNYDASSKRECSNLPQTHPEKSDEKVAVPVPQEEKDVIQNKSGSNSETKSKIEEDTKFDEVDYFNQMINEEKNFLDATGKKPPGIIR